MEKCLICNKHFMSKRSLANHIRIHGMTPSSYKKKFRNEIDKLENKIEGRDFLVCPICHKRLTQLRAHMSRTHKWTLAQFNESGLKASSDTQKLLNIEKSRNLWSNKSSEERDNWGKHISKTKSDRWTKEDSDRLTEARRNCPDCYEKISKGVLKWYDAQSDKYKNSLITRLKSQRRGRRIEGSDSIKSVIYRSRWEHDLSEKLKNLRVEFIYEPFWIKYFDDNENRERRYCPDFYIESKNLVLEVKPSNFINELAIKKSEACIKQGYKFHFITEKELNDLNILKSIVI